MIFCSFWLLFATDSPDIGPSVPIRLMELTPHYYENVGTLKALARLQEEGDHSEGLTSSQSSKRPRDEEVSVSSEGEEEKNRAESVVTEEQRVLVERENQEYLKKREDSPNKARYLLVEALRILRPVDNDVLYAQFNTVIDWLEQQGVETVDLPKADITNEKAPLTDLEHKMNATPSNDRASGTYERVSKELTGWAVQFVQEHLPK